MLCPERWLIMWFHQSNSSDRLTAAQLTIYLGNALVGDWDDVTDKLPDGIFEADDWLGNFLAALKENKTVKTWTVDDNIVSLQVILIPFLFTKLTSFFTRSQNCLNLHDSSNLDISMMCWMVGFESRKSRGSRLLHRSKSVCGRFVSALTYNMKKFESERLWWVIREKHAFAEMRWPEFWILRWRWIMAGWTDRASARPSWLRDRSRSLWLGLRCRTRGS